MIEQVMGKDLCNHADHYTSFQSRAAAENMVFLWLMKHDLMCSISQSCSVAEPVGWTLICHCYRGTEWSGHGTDTAAVIQPLHVTSDILNLNLVIGSFIKCLWIKITALVSLVWFWVIWLQPTWCSSYSWRENITAIRSHDGICLFCIRGYQSGWWPFCLNQIIPYLHLHDN